MQWYVGHWELIRWLSKHLEGSDCPLWLPLYRKPVGWVCPNPSHFCRYTIDYYVAGILTALTQPNPDALRKAIRQTRQLTSKPFGVNLTILPTINPPDYEGFARAAVEEGVKIIETAGSNRKLIMSCIWVDTEFSALEAKPFIEYFKKNGCIIIHKCTSIRHAMVRKTIVSLPHVDHDHLSSQSSEKLGVDVLSIDGFECSRFNCAVSPFLTGL